MEFIELRETVEALVQEVEKTHRYSMSRIYEAHNQVFGKSEKPQSCASCLIRKTQDLRKWLSENPLPASAITPTVSKPQKGKTKRPTAK